MSLSSVFLKFKWGHWSIFLFSTWSMTSRVWFIFKYKFCLFYVKVSTLFALKHYRPFLHFGQAEASCAQINFKKWPIMIHTVLYYWLNTIESIWLRKVGLFRKDRPLSMELCDKMDPPRTQCKHLWKRVNIDSDVKKSYVLHLEGGNRCSARVTSARINFGTKC